MKVVAFASRKGGSGKTTLAINVAVLASKQGRACLIDMDPQGSIGAWKRMREQSDHPGPLTETCAPNDLRKLVGRLEREGCKWICIDTPPDTGPAVRAAIQIADYVVIPVRPDLINFHSITETIRVAALYQRPYVVVINEAPPKRDDQEAPLVRSARAQVEQAGAQSLYFGKMWRGQITHLVGIPYALNRGLAVSEYAATDPCAQDIARFWTGLNRLLGRIDR